MMSLATLLKKIKRKRARRAVLARFNRDILTRYPKPPVKAPEETYIQWKHRVDAYGRVVERVHRLLEIERKEEEKR